MTKAGKRLIAAAEEMLAIAEGKAEPQPLFGRNDRDHVRQGRPTGTAALGLVDRSNNPCLPDSGLHGRS